MITALRRPLNNTCRVATFAAHSQDVTRSVVSEFLKRAKQKTDIFVLGAKQDLRLVMKCHCFHTSGGLWVCGAERVLAVYLPLVACQPDDDEDNNGGDDYDDDYDDDD